MNISGCFLWRMLWSAGFKLEISFGGFIIAFLTFLDKRHITSLGSIHTRVGAFPIIPRNLEFILQMGYNRYGCGMEDIGRILCDEKTGTK